MANVNPEFVSAGSEPVTAATIVAGLFYTAGVLLFAKWLIDTSLGRRALADAPARRNRMPPYTPFIPFAIWFLGIALLQWLWRQLVGTPAGWREVFLDNLFYCVSAAITIIAILLLARVTFARGLRGFGLRPRTIPRDFAWACVNLLAVWPIVLGMIVLTAYIGKALFGEQFEIPRHVGLELITEPGALPLQILIIVLAVVIAPLVEEMLFRGVLQTALRSYTGRPWLSIAITAALFARIHTDAPHWPALFVLAMGLGYAYEKSGSLLRPIFMHALFNGITIVAALTEPPSA